VSEKELAEKWFRKGIEFHQNYEHFRRTYIKDEFEGLWKKEREDKPKVWRGDVPLTHYQEKGFYRKRKKEPREDDE